VSSSRCDATTPRSPTARSSSGAEEQHRGHAIIEQAFAELIDGPPPTLRITSGVFDANNAWLTYVAIAHNLPAPPPPWPGVGTPPPERPASAGI
jgi:hypothetical protein